MQPLAIGFPSLTKETDGPQSSKYYTVLDREDMLIHELNPVQALYAKPLGRALPYPLEVLTMTTFLSQTRTLS